MNCPKCNTQAEERALLTSFFMYCPTCKDDIAALHGEFTQEVTPSTLESASTYWNASYFDPFTKNRYDWNAKTKHWERVSG